MKTSGHAEFAQFRFVRNAEGNVIPLPAQGIDEKNLLVLDGERWGLARLHIFEGAATRQDKLEAFQEELRQIADIRSDSVTRLITWGRDSEELFYADEMQDGEPLPEYLDRVGGVPFPVAAEWILQLVAFLEQVPKGLPSFDRFTTLNFQVVIDRYQQVRPVFSEFYGWTKPGAQVQEHAREWYLAQIFCSLIAGVPVRTFYRESLPRNFEELPSSVQSTVLEVLGESGGTSCERLASELRELASPAAEHYAAVALPRLLVREWMAKDLADSYRSEAGLVFDELTDREGERYAIGKVIRGKASHVQVLPGPDSIPREGWLNQHHDATRRPGRPMLHQLQVNYLEDRSSLTLVGEEQIDGVDLSTLLLYLGARQVEESKPLLRRVSSAVTLLEQNAVSCSVWWLPPENVLFVTGTRSITGSIHLVERKGAQVWDEWGVKLRLHQTTTTLREGVNLPGPVRALSRVPGKQFEHARRSSLALPLIFFVLTCHRFRWRKPVDTQADLPAEVSDLLERYRLALLEDPAGIDSNLFEDFLAIEPVSEKPQAVAETAGGVQENDGFDTMLAETLHREPVELTGTVGPATSAGSPDFSDELPEEPDWDEEEYEREDPPERVRFFRGWWLALWAVVLALGFGYFFAGWNSGKGAYTVPAEVRFPVTDYEVPAAPGPEEVVVQLESYLVEQARPDLLPHAGALGVPESREAIDAFLAARMDEGDGAAARLHALLAGLDGVSVGEVLNGFAEAARLGDAAAQFDLAVLVLVKGLGNMDPAVAGEMLKRSATSGNPDARELRGVLLIEQSPIEARELIEAAAKQNHLGAHYHLGLLAANGVGGEVDPALAASQFEAAAAQGELRAMFALGRCHEAGFGKEPDFVEASRWIKMAAALGHPGALAWCQAREIEVPDTAVKSEAQPGAASAPDEFGEAALP